MKPMRRKRQALDRAACLQILEHGDACVLALAGSPATDGFPYAVPVNYCYAPTRAQDGDASRADDAEPLGSVFIHSATAGAKLDALAVDARVSLCVIDERRIVPEELTTYFSSVIAFGRARRVEDDEARRSALRALAAKYAPDLAHAAVDQEIDQLFSQTTIIEIALEELTGKRAIELVKRDNR